MSLGKGIAVAACVVSATYLIANGYDHGWGWMILLAFVIA